METLRPSTHRPPRMLTTPVPPPQTLSIYAASTGARTHCIDVGMALLSAAWLPQQDAAVAGGVDGSVIHVDFSTSAVSSWGKHGAGVKVVLVSATQGQVYTAGWDKALRVWSASSGDAVGEPVNLPERAYAGDIMDSHGTLVIACAGQHIVVHDITTPGLPVKQARESPMTHQTRVISLYPDGTGYALGSIEGRVAMEWYDEADAASKKFSFKCHRTKTAAGDAVYPVNAIVFHPQHGTFATGGADGTVLTWDGAARRRLAKITAAPTSISALAFSHAGDRLVIAASYTWELGEEGSHAAPAPSLCIRDMADSEVMPKSK